MIRGSLNPDAAHGYALVSAGKGSSFQRRTGNGAVSTSTAGPWVYAPQWLRVVREGTTVTALLSSDGAIWTTIGSDLIALGQTAYVGIAVTSHNIAQVTTSVISDAEVVTASPPSGLPAPLRNMDIGSPEIAGSTAYNQGVYAVTGAGRDIWDSADEFHYVYQPVTGDVDLSVRVQSIEYAHRWSKAGVMIREKLTAGSAHAFAGISAGQGYVFQRRPAENGWSLHTGSSGSAPGWVRLKRTGALITAYRSSDGVNWSVIGSESFSMAETVYVGLAITSHNTTQAATAIMDGFRVTYSQSSNQTPTVTLSGPVEGASYAAPATVEIGATASDSDGTIARVEFYNGSTLLNTDTTAPYSYSWSNVAAGTYGVRAVAYDNAGASASSATSIITVSAALPAPTAVIFTASTDHATHVTSYLLEIFANGADPNSASPVASSDLGKPAPATNGDITVDRATLFSGLSPAPYVLTVSALGPDGKTRSAAITFTR